MPSSITVYRVFIASPGGLQAERAAFRQALARYNELEGVHRGVLFIPVGWEDTLGGVGRPQKLINEDVRSADYMVVLLWDRWGSPTGESATSTSGTEEEYSVALECLRDPNRPMIQVVAFFKAVDPIHLADPGPQLAKVLGFRRRLEEEKILLYHTFDTESAFVGLLSRHLAAWMRAHERGHEVAPSNEVSRETSVDPQLVKTPKLGQVEEQAIEVMPPPQRPPTIFICYAREDNKHADPSRRWLDRLLEHLKPVALQDQASIWSDQDIAVGEDWHAQIQSILQNAKVSILLISPAFLNSTYIRNNELPVLLKRAKDRGLIVLPIILRPCLFEEVTFRYPDPVNGPSESSLSSLQAANTSNDALNGLDENAQDLVLLTVAKRTLEILQNSKLH